MKKAVLLSLLTATLLLFAGCKDKWTVGKDIASDDVKDFYYTYENINYNAFYQRYRFYAENGKHMFSHETRKREGAYGPTGKEDVKLEGTFELTDEEWGEFFRCLEGGTVVERSDSAETGGRGPWLYLYWTKDQSKYQEYSFASAEKELAFEAFCEKLAGSR